MYRFVSKILEIDSGFGSISRVGINGSGRFQYLEPKPDPTVNLVIATTIKINNYYKAIVYIALKKASHY